MGKYQDLADRLSSRPGAKNTSSFAELDSLAVGLPPSTRADLTWWGSAEDRTRMQAHVWPDA
jgi:hypothetical protein